MTRENYTIIFGAQRVTKHKWNSSIRVTEQLIGDIARAESTTYELTNSFNSPKGLYGFEHGFRIWTGRNGNVVTFTIQKQPT